MSDLLDAITDYYNFVEADHEVSHGKRDHRDYICFEREREWFFNSRPKQIKEKTYRYVPHREKTIYEPKRQDLLIPNLSDRVTLHALIRVIKPYLESYFHQDSFSCCKGSEYVKVYFE